MVIIKVIGGLGNQMFEIALGLSFIARMRIIRYDTTALWRYLEEYQWNSAFSVFNIKADFAIENEVKKFADLDESIIDKFRRKIGKRKSTHIIEKDNGNYDASVLEKDNIYLEGYWQSYKYFDGYRKDILELFRFPDLPTDENKKIKNQIQNCKNSVSVHIRLGDYLEGKNKKIYGDICTDDYYSKAIYYFKNKYKSCHFFVFSNDKKYIKKYVNDDCFTVIGCNDEMTAWADMYLMTLCNHNIIANSSFSWWGAWLNQHNNKEVIAPKRWINTKEMKDICPPDWLRF